MQESGQLHALATLSPYERAPDSHYTEGLEGTTAIWMLNPLNACAHYSGRSY